MLVKEITVLVISVAGLILISACSPESDSQNKSIAAMPAVNEQNCTVGTIAKIQDQNTRERFQLKCQAAASNSWRSGKFVPSTGKGWKPSDVGKPFAGK